MSWFPSYIYILKWRLERFYAVFSNSGAKQLINVKSKYSRISRYGKKKKKSVFLAEWISKPKSRFLKIERDDYIARLHQPLFTNLDSPKADP